MSCANYDYPTFLCAVQESCYLSQRQEPWLSAGSSPPTPPACLPLSLGLIVVQVTPEPDFSYASFETNVRLPDYNDMVRGVLEVFRPKKFTMTLFAEKTGMEHIKEVCLVVRWF